MGIRGLTGFIDKNQGLLHQHELCCSSVVIDGNNFYHYLYHACHLQCNFGGDYDLYRTDVISTFQSMKECSIKPYVVLDGAYTVDGRKLKTSLSRAVSRIKFVDSLTNGHSGQALPVLAYETFIQVMVELGIPHAMCQFEADSEIATLANRLQCPVISNDSDFYIFDVECGFLPLDYIDFRPIRKQCATGNTTNAFLHCYKYHVDNFISSFNLERSSLPIFATLLGNDFIDASAFSTFYSKFKVPKIVSKKFSLPPKMTKVISVLHWLHTQADDKGVAYLRDQILAYIPPQKCSIVRKLFDKAILGYTEVNTFVGCDLYHYFAQGTSSSFHASCDFHSYNGKPFPTWFVQAATRGELTPHILNVIILHRVILLTQMESLSLASSYNASFFLRNIMYAILLKDDCYFSVDSKSEDSSHLSSESQSVSAVSESIKFQQDTSDSQKLLGEFKHDSDSEIKKENYEDEETNLSDDQGDKIDSDKSEEEISDHEVMQDTIEADHCASLSRRSNSKANIVEEYTRANKQLKKSVLEISSAIEKYSLPGLQDMSSFTLEQKREVLYQSFGAVPSSLKCFPNKLKVFILCVMSWIRCCEPKVTFSQMDSLILSVLFLAARRELKARKRKQAPKDGRKNTSKEGLPVNLDMLSDHLQSFDIDLVCSQCESSDLKSLTANLDKYHKTAPSFNRTNTFNSTYCHVFAQLQAILVDACHLNRLLQQPVPNPKLAELINGTLLYNLTADISARPSPKLFVSMMFSEKDVLSPLQGLYYRLCNFFVEEMKLAAFLVHPTQARGRKKRKKKRTNERNSVLSKGSEHEQEDESSGTQEVEEFSEFAVNNKFGLLMLCD
ncbi:hypothetical protein RRG08_058247 [Elysia crispata]|uniref:XPG N-terminal domain-containing protein n=1 Tax=Elysia crispata TaxID=231223 RepID=A0AAE1D671_9GAST|nr:hypothetical protein RRG08_058247 [Elysia crispata]